MRRLAYVLCLMTASAYGQDTLVAKHAAEKGATQCVNAINALTKYTQDDDSYAYLNIWGQAKPRDSIFNSLQVRNYGAGSSVVSIVGVTPTSGGMCDATATQIMVSSEQNCAIVRDQVFGKWKVYGELAGHPVYEDPTNDGNVALLVQTTRSCLIVKTGTFFYEKTTK